MAKLKKIIALIGTAERIFNSSTSDWEAKYDLIFGLDIWQKIRKAGYSFEWSDPDTTYQEDITAYVEALRVWRVRYSVGL